MAVIRVKHNRENPYLQINRAAMNDARLSFKAVGIHTYLMGKPDNWVIREEELAASHTDGTTAVRSGLKELRALGYVRTIQKREDGKIAGWETHIYEIPVDEPDIHYDEEQETNNVGNLHCSLATTLVSNDVGNQPLKDNVKEKSNERTDTAAAPHPSVGPNGEFFSNDDVPVRNPKPGLTDFHLECGKRFKEILQKNECVAGNKTRTTLAEGFRLLELTDGIHKKKIVEVLVWYRDNFAKQYVPKVYTSEDFRKEWNRILRAKNSNAYEPTPEDLEKTPFDVAQSVHVDEPISDEEKKRQHNERLINEEMTLMKMTTRAEYETYCSEYKSQYGEDYYPAGWRH